MIHVYYGKGKGKTTAALGLVMRAVGAGWRVVIVQFLKQSDSSELSVLQELSQVSVLRGKNSDKFSFAMTGEEKEAARVAHNENLQAALAMVWAGECDLLVLDESLGALEKDLLDEELVKTLIKQKPRDLEIVFTGRTMPGYIENAADYISHIECIKHPYTKGIAARKGIEL